MRRPAPGLQNCRVGRQPRTRANDARATPLVRRPGYAKFTMKPASMPGTQVIRERSTLRVRLLGALALERDGRPLRLPRHKLESLLAYLLLHPLAHTREKLATLCWGDVPDVQARHSLRTALNTLRKYVGADLLLVEHDTIRLNPAFTLWTDIGE